MDGTVVADGKSLSTDFVASEGLGEASCLRRGAKEVLQSVSRVKSGVL